MINIQWQYGKKYGENTVVNHRSELQRDKSECGRLRSKGKRPFTIKLRSFTEHRDQTLREWWEKSYDQCIADYSNAGAKPKLSEASRDIICQASGQQRKSGPVVAKEIAEKQKEYATGRTVNNYCHREGLKPFHVIPKPFKSDTYISDRLWLCDWLKDWIAEDFLHLAASDEFYIWTVRRPLRNIVLIQNVIPF